MAVESVPITSRESKERVIKPFFSSLRVSEIFLTEQRYGVMTCSIASRIEAGSSDFAPSLNTVIPSEAKREAHLSSHAA